MLGRAQKFEKGGGGGGGGGGERNFLFPFPLKISEKTKKNKRSSRLSTSNLPPKSSEDQNRGPSGTPLICMIAS